MNIQIQVYLPLPHLPVKRVDSAIALGANRHDLTLTWITSEGQVTKRPELTAERPQGIYLDQGYNYDEVRDRLCEFGLTTPIRKHGEAAKERREDASRKSHRWVSSSAP